MVRRGPDLPSYCLNCTQFVKLIFSKIIENAATRCHILKLKCTKFDFSSDSASDPTGELTALPGHLAEFKGPTSKGEKDGKKGKRGGGKGRVIIIMIVMRKVV